MSLQQFLSILRARWGAAALILALSVTTAIGWIVLRPARWSTRVPVLVDVQSGDVGGGYAPALVASFMATQLDIARSDRVMERALDRLDAHGEPPSVPARPASALSASQREQRLERVRALQEGLDVRPARESNILYIGWTGDSAARAARVANAVAGAFVDVALSLKTDPAKQDAVWFEDQVRVSRQKLETAQMRLAQFQQKAGIVGSEQADHELARLNQLSAQLALVQAQTTDAQSKRESSRDTVADVMQSPLVNGLRADIARLQARQQELAATLGPRHPQMVRTEAELASLHARLSEETGRIGTSIETSFQSGRARERELGAALDTQRERVLALNQDRARLSLLQQDVDAARRAFEAVSTSASKTQLQSMVTQAHVMVLSPAATPLLPVGPTTYQALLAGLGAGVLLGVMGALMLEFANRRIRSVDDIHLAAGLPVLAVVPTAGYQPLALPLPQRRLGFLPGSVA